ncbi:hypothetical protein JVX90_19790 [Gordonia sp. PDNC005]|uniref:hypothetical protein n=1 Tax=unclassified Gordonia (in: high G+C Gram-positive bacteria) TaxID=2657482 RepID=UPI0019634592|nr:hypothetical protein [Gordonia sp. PDNC005]QRY62575.1 hypothetical protein JVX90_19790 [Gordonia sp. PDNC005]
MGDPVIIIFERGLQKYAIEWTSEPPAWPRIGVEQCWGVDADLEPSPLESDYGRSVWLEMFVPQGGTYMHSCMGLSILTQGQPGLEMATTSADAYLSDGDFAVESVMGKKPMWMGLPEDVVDLAKDRILSWISKRGQGERLRSFGCGFEVHAASLRGVDFSARILLAAMDVHSDDELRSADCMLEVLGDRTTVVASGMRSDPVIHDPGRGRAPFGLKRHGFDRG